MADLLGSRRRRVQLEKPRFGRSLTLPELHPTRAGAPRMTCIIVELMLTEPRLPAKSINIYPDPF
jgi:hypothetical protein